MALLGGTLARTLLPGDAPFEVGRGFVGAVLLAVAVVVLTTVAAAVRVAREPLDALVRQRTYAVAAVGARRARRLPRRRRRHRCPRLRHRQPRRAVRPGRAGAAGAARRPAAGPPARSGGERGGSSAAAPRPPRQRRDPARDGTPPGDPGGDRGGHGGQRARASSRSTPSPSAHATGPTRASTTPEHRWCCGWGAATSSASATRSAQADPTGRRATPVLVSRDTLAVEPEGFRRIAYFPRGAPTDAEWRAIAPPAKEPVDLTGSRFSLDVRSGDELTAVDALGGDSELAVGFVVVTDTGTRRRIRLGTVPQPGERATPHRDRRGVRGGLHARGGGARRRAGGRRQRRPRAR